MIDRDDIAEAARNADAEAEQHGIREWCRMNNIDIEGLTHVATQRGLRIVLVKSDRLNELQLITTQTDPKTVRMSPQETADMVHYSTIWIDGFAAGLKVRDDGD